MGKGRLREKCVEHIKGISEKLKAFEGLIFDVDGTLYSQSSVRLGMALRMGKYYACHLCKVKELWAVAEFRKFREKKDNAALTMEELYSLVAGKVGLAAPRVSQAVQRWMFAEPLELLKRFRYESVIDYINEAYEQGTKIAIYSDYPAKEKLEVLGVHYTRLFVSGDEGFPAQKPCSEAMETILRELNVPIEKLLYVGDRPDKDEASAKIAGVVYSDIRNFRASLA